VRFITPLQGDPPADCPVIKPNIQLEIAQLQQNRATDEDKAFQPGTLGKEHLTQSHAHICRPYVPAGGSYLYRKRKDNRVITHRVTRVINTTSAVVRQTGRCTRYTAESLAAAWYTLYLLHKMQHFCAKEWNLPPCRSLP
jgi:hypothetical protein